MEELKIDPKQKTSGKIYFLLGLLAGVAIISTLGFFALLSVLYGAGGQSKILARSNNNIALNTNANLNAQPQIPNEPSADASKLSPITEDDHIRGNINAPITMIEFSDFQCPYCARFEDTLKQILADYKDKVRLVYRHFPLSFHAEAEKAAEASECAWEQGKFWEMHDRIFAANQAGTMSVAQWKKDAKALGLNTTKFNNCLDSGKYASKVGSQLAEGQAAGVEGTPATFIDGELISGALPYESIKSVIESKLSQ